MIYDDNAAFYIAMECNHCENVEDTCGPCTVKMYEAASDILESNRELSEANLTLRAEVAQLTALAEQRLDEIITLKKARAALEAHLTGAPRVITELTQERDTARMELQHIRTMLDDGTEEDATALDMVKQLHAQLYVLKYTLSQSQWRKEMTP